MDSKEIRYRNARLLVREADGISAFARKLGKSQPHVSSFAGEHPTKGIGAKIARDIEQAFGRERGWLDVPHAQPDDVVLRLGDQFRRLREAANETQAAVAKRAGVDNAAVADLEAGLLTELGLVKVESLFQAYGLSLGLVPAC